MLRERIEAKWIDCFAETFALCGVKGGDVACVLSETQSRAVNVELAALACEAGRHGIPARAFHAQALRAGAGALHRRVGRHRAHRAGGAGARWLHLRRRPHRRGPAACPELAGILSRGARVLMVSNEHPEVLERQRPTPVLEPRSRPA